MASSMLTWIILWLVKASFLALLWDIIRNSPGLRKAWLVIAIYTFLSFWPLFLAPLWQCGNPSKYGDVLTCQAFPTSEEFASTKSVWGLNLALHISSEILILGLPLYFISNFQMSRVQKIGTASFFCVVLVTIIIGFIRNLASMCADIPFLCGGDDMKWVWMFQFGLILEPAFAVSVCTLPPYKDLILKLFKRKRAVPDLQLNAMQAGQVAFHQNKSRQAGHPADSITELERNM